MLDNKTPAPDTKKIPNELKLRLQGKLDRFEKFDGKEGPIYESLIILPAPNEYSSPHRFFVKSDRQIDKQGANVDILVTIKSRYWKHNTSGKVNYTPELWLDAA